MQRIVLLAPYGLLGAELARSLAGLGQLFTLSRADVDFADPTATMIRVAALSPTLIVNAAGFTAVDLAETAATQAYLLNAKLPAALAQLAQHRGCWLCHFSSDYVYSGAGVRPWAEQDIAAPLSVYGASKLAGDEAILQSGAKALILRTSWLYGHTGRHFFSTMLQRFQQGQSVSVVADQIGAPTPARLVAQYTAQVVRAVLSGKVEATGVYHLACRGETSWFGFAQTILAWAQQHGIGLDSSLTAINSDRYRQLFPQAAARPFNSRLQLDKFEQTFAVTLPDWSSEFAAVSAQYRVD